MGPRSHRPQAREPEVNQRESKFLQNTVLAAQQTQRSYGVPASITIAQAILESGWGESALAVKANNYFGIKAALTSEPYVEFPTTEFISGRQAHVLGRFARYASPIDCFKAHGALLATSKRYIGAMAVAADPEAFAAQLQVCGYSTSPDYASRLIDLMRIYDLTQYDIFGPIDGPAKEAAA